MDGSSTNLNRKIQSWIFFLFLILVAILLFNLPRLSIPFIIAYIFKMIVNPFLPKLNNIGINKTLIITFLTLALIFLIVLPFFKIIPVLREESENLQYYIPKLETFFRQWYTKLNAEIGKYGDYELSEDYLIDALEYGRSSIKTILFKISNIITSMLEWVLLIPLFFFFLLKDSSRIKNYFLSIVPNPIFERIYYLSFQFNKKLGDYIFAKFIEAAIIGLITTTGLFFFGIRFSLLLGLAAGITNIVPYLGPFIGAIPGIVVCLIDNGIGPHLIGVLILYGFANILDLALVFPILVSKIVDIHPLLVIISVILGSQYAGMLGMIISIPMAVIVKLVFIEIYNEIYTTSYSDNL